MGHSFSKSYFERKFEQLGIDDAEYRNFPIENIGLLPQLVEQTPGLCGLNVTAPYKAAVMPFLDTVSDSAREIGAVNCIRISGGRMDGYNTDASGFLFTLERFLGYEIWGVLSHRRELRALILGSGGASAAAAYALGQAGIGYAIVSRRAAQFRDLGYFGVIGDFDDHGNSGNSGNHANFGKSDKSDKPGKSGKPYVEILTYDQLDAAVVASYRLIINTTPLGTWPDTETAPPIPYDLLTPAHYLFDMVYNPAETLFMRRGQAQGAKTTNGLEMLSTQADLSWDIWGSTSDRK